MSVIALEVFAYKPQISKQSMSFKFWKFSMKTNPFKTFRDPLTLLLLASIGEDKLLKTLLVNYIHGLLVEVVRCVDLLPLANC